MPKEYSKLNKYEKYDKKAAEQLAEATNEIRQLEARVIVLRDLVRDNADLHPFIWTTAEGKSIALHDIELDHFVNILQHIVNSGRTISKSLRAEASKRKVALPGATRYIESGMGISDSDNYDPINW